jgi:gas vesicle protein
MKKLILLVGAFACLIVAPNASAQELSKKEYKQWKKQMKSMEVEDFKQLVEEKEGLETQISSVNSQMSSLQARLSDKNSEVARLEAENKDLQNKVAEMEAAQTMSPEAGEIDATGGQATRVAKGVVFKVQIGAFRNKELAKYFNNNGSFDGEVDNSLERYTLGVFTDYWEADKFKKYLREMGVKDAWIVSYKDGSRVPLKDVLEGVI